MKAMQTKLRTGFLLFVASLLWASQALAASYTKPVSKPNRQSKIHFVGVASWYGLQHQGRKMANGKRFDRKKLTAACWDLPLGTIVRVTNLQNGHSVVVTITDRGPNHRLHRAIDLSEAAADRLDYVHAGLARVYFAPISPIETEPAVLDATLVVPIVRGSQGPAPLPGTQE